MTAGVATEPASAQPSFDGWMENVDNYDGLVDATGQSEVSVTVGADGNNGNFAFDPPAIRVDPGTTIVWEWNGKGGQHNVNAIEGADFESELVQEAGHVFDYTAEETGVIKYQCDPHAGLGMKGVVVVGDVAVGEDDGEAGGGDATGDGEIDYGGWFTADARGGAVSNFTGTVDRRGESEVTVTVGAEGNGGNFAFGPAAIWVDPGTTVRFEWNGKGGEHNVVSESGPAALDSGDPVTEAGVHYEFTFEESGVNTYYCVPHLSLGMKAAVAVGDDVPRKAVGGDGGGDGGGGGRPLPGNDIGAVMLGALLGITGLAVLSIIAAEFYGSLKQAGKPEVAPEESPTPESEHGIVREIGHDEFDPTGTASLIALYFLILLVMWVFVYFIEFLGRGVTIIG